MMVSSCLYSNCSIFTVEGRGGGDGSDVVQLLLMTLFSDGGCGADFTIEWRSLACRLKFETDMQSGARYKYEVASWGLW
ncbi:predicted protein [Arabidopsis lyrata subsp. lyrata]|uniref:Predicted protein n=1 Tax=Arabidopsis lyrata subsp. lyrata TaxID=81972 RepID=D7LGQ7_ARALL|nr:predicted protein [Arabidopsis lyrata subsp. lyrata]